MTIHCHTQTQNWIKYIVNLPNFVKCLPIRFNTFNCLEAFLHIFEIWVLNFSWQSIVTPSNLNKINIYIEFSQTSNIFLNDIFNFVEESILYNYADDNTLSYSDTELNIWDMSVEF
jgi:predicted ABC-type exoprotein transport system permease subunit